jgi:hypothetical protein
LHVESIHGETIEVLSGSLAGQKFTGVRETESDQVFSSELGIDPRAKRIIRFREGHAPELGSQDRIRTSDGKTWTAVRQPESAYLTVDFELIENVAGKDT